MLDDRQFKLADLVTLGQIRVKVVLARKHRAWRDRRVHGEAKHCRHVHDFLIEHRQNTRVTEVDQAGLRIGFGSVGSRRARKNLGLGRELRMNLETDNHFPTRPHLNSSGKTLCQSVCCW